MKASDTNGFCITILKSITEMIECSANRILKEYDVTFSQARIIGVLYGQDGLPLKELEKIMLVSQQTMAGTIHRMEVKGFVKTETEDGGHRAKKVYLTEQGKSMVDTIIATMKETDEKVLADLTQEEKDSLTYILGKIEKQLAETAANC